MLKKINNPVVKVFIFNISSILVFVSSGHQFEESVSNLSLKLTEIFFTPVFHSMFFNIFEIIILSFLIYLFIKSKISVINANKKEKFIFVFAILCWFLNMINPNTNTNNPILGMPLFSNVTEYLFIFLLYIFFFIDKRIVTYIILLLFKYIFILSLVRGLLIMLQYFIGIGVVRFGRVVTLLEYDVLLQYGILTVIFFTAYLSRKDLKMFALTLLFFLIVFLCTVRTYLAPILIAIILILSVFLFKRTQTKKVKIVIFGFIFVLLLVSSFNFLPDPFKRTYYRVLAVLPKYGISGIQEISTTGHWEQSLYTTLSIIEKHIFWGDGYGTSQDVYLKGQTINIHNAYAGLWIKYGLHMTIFYLSFLFLVIHELYKVLIIEKKSFSNFHWYKLALCSFYIGFAITAYVAISTVYTNFRFQFILVLIWTFIFKVSERDFEYIMDNEIRK